MVVFGNELLFVGYKVIDKTGVVHCSLFRIQLQAIHTGVWEEQFVQENADGADWGVDLWTDRTFLWIRSCRGFCFRADDLQHRVRELRRPSIPLFSTTYDECTAIPFSKLLWATHQNEIESVTMSTSIAEVWKFVLEKVHVLSVTSLLRDIWSIVAEYCVDDLGLNHEIICKTNYRGIRSFVQSPSGSFLLLADFKNDRRLRIFDPFTLKSNTIATPQYPIDYLVLDKINCCAYSMTFDTHPCLYKIQLDPFLFLPAPKIF